MAKSTNVQTSARRRPPASTPEAREAQLINLAYDLVEQRLIDGTASSAETTAFIRLGTQKASLERAKLEAEVELAKAKTENLEVARRTEQMMSEAIEAMKTYTGYRGDE